MQKSTVLYITWGYRPTHTAGAIRAVNFVEALVEAGLRVIVLTVGREAGVEKVAEDLTICTVSEDGQMPSELEASSLPRRRRWEPLPGPDATSRSFRAVYRTAHGLIGQNKPSVVFASAPPFPSLLAGFHLAEQYGLGLILEFRDAWFTGMPWPYKNRWQRRGARHWERRCVQKADKIITVTDAYRRILIDAYGAEVGKKTFTIRHGYDARTNDDESILPLIDGLVEDKDSFLITHTGQFQGFDVIERHPWRRIGQGFLRILLGARSCSQLRLEWQCPYNLMAAVAQAAEENQEFRRNYRLVFAGQKFEQIKRWAEQMDLEHVHQLGSIPPAQARKLMRHSDLLVLLLYGITNCDYHWCVPSKIYSYLSTGKTVLALVPAGEARDIVCQAGTGVAAAPDDVSGIAQQLLTIFEEDQSGQSERKLNWEFITQFDLKIQQRKLEEVILSVLEN